MVPGDKHKYFSARLKRQQLYLRGRKCRKFSFRIRNGAADFRRVALHHTAKVYCTGGRMDSGLEHPIRARRCFCMGGANSEWLRDSRPSRWASFAIGPVRVEFFRSDHDGRALQSSRRRNGNCYWYSHGYCRSIIHPAMKIPNPRLRLSLGLSFE